MTTTIKVLGVLGMMMTACSTVSVACRPADAHDEYNSDPEGYARGAREGFEDRKLNLPTGSNSKRKIRRYTVKQLLAIRETVAHDSALEQETQAALAGTGLEKTPSAFKDPAGSEAKG